MSICVHLFIRANPRTVPSDSPRLMKGRSSRYLRDEFLQLRKLPSWWTRSFFLSTAGHVSQDTIRQYIERQYIERQYIERQSKT
jgi:REP-associated tyrosine transposase